MMRLEIVTETPRPECYGSMYKLGEEYMAEKCLQCTFFNKCKKIGAGRKAEKVELPPAPLVRKGEVRSRW